MPANERFVVLGVAPVRREWFRRVGRWANEATLPVEFVKCISTTEVISRLESGQPFSALLVDASSTGLDRDLLDRANAVGCCPIIVDHGLVDRDWHALGARSVIPERFEASDLKSILEHHAIPIGRSATTKDQSPTENVVSVDHGRVVAVTGAGGIGTSTITMAVAQGLASQGSHRPLLLADMALRSSQAMFHDARDVVPGLTELIESHRLGVPHQEETLSNIHAFPERGYDLLLGLRNERDWVSIASRALSATWMTLTGHYQTIVCDITGEFDGLEETGSNDLEDRNRLARRSALHADVVVVVGTPGAWGIHHLVRTIIALDNLGVPAERLFPLVNHAPRHPRARASITDAVGDLLRSRVPGAEGIPSPIFVPTRRNLEAALRDGESMPNAITSPIASAVASLLNSRLVDETSDRLQSTAPVAVIPGTLGTWGDDD